MLKLSSFNNKWGLAPFYSHFSGLMNQIPTDCSLHIPIDNLYYILRRVGLINQAPTTFKSACLIYQTPKSGLANQAPAFLYLGSDWSFDDPRNNRNLYSP